jgi:putative ABC transport system permease protein
MFVVAFDPATDFTITPWLKQRLGDELRLGEAVGGHYVFTPEGEQNIKLYGYFITLRANLEQTGTGLDQTMFFTFDTARDIARISQTQAEQPLELRPNSISAVMVKTVPGTYPPAVALKIMQDVPGVTPIPSLDLFQSFRVQMTGLLRSILAVLSISWVLSVALIGLVFSMAANERRRELGVLRALGATRSFILRSLLAEAGLLALSGAVAGISLAVLSIYLFRDLLVDALGIPFLVPALPSLLVLVVAGLALSLVSVAVAALIPAHRISRQEPAMAMRE